MSRNEYSSTIENITESVYAGFVKSKSQYEVYATVSGVIKETYVAEGQLVKKGRLLRKLHKEYDDDRSFSAYSLFNAGPYAESGLNLYYLVMSIYGWSHLIKKRNEPPVKVDFAGRHQWIITVAIVLGGWLVL